MQYSFFEHALPSPVPAACLADSSWSHGAASSDALKPWTLQELVPLLFEWKIQQHSSDSLDLQFLLFF